MGSSPSAFLAYGYDLGSGESWKFRETDEYGYLDSAKFAWHDDDDDAPDFIDQAGRRLLAEIAGFTETWETWSEEGNFYAAERAAKERLGVVFETYSYGEYPMHVLAAKVIDVDDGTALVVDLAELVAHPDRPKWDAALFDAVKTLGITPVQEKPSWLLCAYYS
ncbi:hypothetical protein [Nonomuraea sp. NPDC050643]|uniref:hypothetical protein n=1 Tax=Nonomuraea sp. NPDC050643 TaxID=3155660 RepID=UPI0033FC63EF